MRGAMYDNFTGYYLDVPRGDEAAAVARHHGRAAVLAAALLTLS